MNGKEKALEILLDDTIKIAEEAIRLAEKQFCSHEETHRGGFIWTICDMCGMKWADDRGGMKENPDVARADKLRDRLQEIRIFKPGKY